MKILKYKIAADIDSMSNLYILPHLALLFTAVSTMKMISTIYWFERGGRDDGLPNLESFLVVALMLPIFIGYKYGKSPSITNRIRLFTKLSSVCFIWGNPDYCRINGSPDILYCFRKPVDLRRVTGNTSE